MLNILDVTAEMLVNIANKHGVKLAINCWVSEDNNHCPISLLVFDTTNIVEHSQHLEDSDSQTDAIDYLLGLGVLTNTWHEIDAFIDGYDKYNRTYQDWEMHYSFWKHGQNLRHKLQDMGMIED